MRVYMKEIDNLYSWVCMLAPLDNTLRVELIWLPNRLRNERNGVKGYEFSFYPTEESKPVYHRWLDGLPELLVNAKGTRVQGLVLEPNENVILIEHDTDWEFHLLNEMANLPMWKEDKEFDLFSKLGPGIKANVLK